MSAELPGELPYPDPPLTDGRVLLRQWRETDLACIEEASRDSLIPEATTVPRRFDEGEGQAFVHRQWSRADAGVGVSLAVTTDEVAVGLAIISLRPQRGVGGIGYWIVGSRRGRGYATAAVRLLTDWGLDALGLRRVEAWVEPDNLASQRVLAAAGYELEGRLRRFLELDGRIADALVLSRLSSNA